MRRFHLLQVVELCRELGAGSWELLGCLSLDLPMPIRPHDDALEDHSAVLAAARVGSCEGRWQLVPLRGLFIARALDFDGL